MEIIQAIGVSCIAIILTYWGYQFLEWIWFRPKRLEKILRDQGFNGNPYRLLLGDQKDSGEMIRAAKNRPIGLNDDIKQRVMPHIVANVNKYGKKSFMWVGRWPRVNIMEPELGKEVLNKHYMFQKNFSALDPITKHLLVGVGAMEGEPWAERRLMLKNAFQFEKLKLMLPAFHAAGMDMVNNWEKAMGGKKTAEYDVWHDLEMISGNAVSRTLFGNSYQENQRIFRLMKELVDLTIQAIQAVYIPGTSIFPSKRNTRIKEVSKEVAERITGMLDTRRKAMKAGEKSSDDFLGILLTAGMNTSEIIDECKLFYFAGQDSTSSLLVWTLVCMCKYPEWQQRCREEVKQVFGDKSPDYDGISSLKDVTMFMYEVLRMYPPIVELTKIAQEDTKLGDLFIPAGVQVMMPQMLLHQDTDIWGDDATEFKPERFINGELEAQKRQGSYFPFSLGPRMCMGFNFALLEAKMAISLVLQRFSFELSPKYKHAPFALITMQPQYGCPLILHKV